MLGFAILLLFNLLGLMIEYLVSIPIPPNVIGLILFVVSLFTGLVKLEWVEEAAGFLLRHLLLFFIPIVVSLMTYYTYLREHLLAIVVVVIATTLIVMLTTGGFVQYFISKKERE